MTPPVELCFGCMEVRDPSGICPRCGYQHGTPPTSPLYLKPGTVLQDQYVVGRVLGHGGFGVTYLGFDSVLQRKIAIKEYLPSSLASRQTEGPNLTVHYDQLRADFDFGLQRFLEEARTLARFHGSPHIIWVMNFFSANGTAYMVMEYLEGETFETYLERNKGRISFAAARTILTPVMEALTEIHRQSMLHRDISPDNIFLVTGGPVKLLDFGAARYAMSMRSQGLSVIVKEGYAPEEQYISKGEQGPWTDVYALAGTMYRSITGHLPTLALERRLTGDLTLPSRLGSDISAECEPVLMKALAIDAGERYQTVEEFQSALTAAAGVDSAAGTLRRVTGETQALNFGHVPLAARARLSPGGPTVRAAPAGNSETRTDRRFAMFGVGALLLLGLCYAAYRGIHTTPKPTAELQVNAFSAKDVSVVSGSATTLNWDVSHADRVAILPDPGPVAASGSAQVTPRATTTYRLTAFGADGKSVEKSVQVAVVRAGMPSEAKPDPFPAPAETPPPPTTAVSPSETSVPPATPALPSPTPAVVVPDPLKNQFLVSRDRGKAVATLGVLEVKEGRVIYRSANAEQAGEDFDVPLSAIAEARKNHRFLPGGQAFHIKFKNGTSYNFDPKNASAGQILKVLAQKSAE